MTAFLFIVVVVLAIWIARSSSRTQKLESLISKLTFRVFQVEEELKQLHKLSERERVQPEPAPVKEKPVQVEIPPLKQAPIPPPPLPVTEPETTQEVKPEAPRKPPPLPAPAFQQPEPASFSFSRLLNLEEALGTNWLNKLGIVILVIGVALFLAYQMRELGPAGKVTTGYLLSTVMLGAGVFFERRRQWQILARAGIGGGWSLLYFTTYAMYHVPAAHVLSSESADLALLLIVAAGMIAHTLRYDSQVVTGLAFLLAFTTVNLSRSGASSLIASAILAAGLGLIAVRRRWFEMEIAGMAAAYCNHYLWLRPVIDSMHGHVHVFPGYTASSVLLCGYWIIFRASYVVRRIENERQEQISTVAALLNATLFVSVMGYQSLHPELAFQFFLGIGAAEFLAGQLPITRQRRTAFVVLSTLGSCFLVVAFPYRYSGASLSGSWLAEAEALLLTGVFLREIVFRRLGMLAALAVWIQMIGGDGAMVLGERMYHLREGGQPGLALLFGVVAAVLYANSHGIPRRWPDLIQTGLERLCFRRLSHMATILAIAGAWIAWPHAWTAIAWAALGLALTFAGRRWSVQELSIDGLACMCAAVVRVLFVNLGATQTLPHVDWMSERLLTIAIIVALLYIGSRWAGLTGVLAADRISPIYTWVAASLGALLAWYELRPASVALCWSLGALVLLEAGLKRQSLHLRLQAYAALLVSFVRVFFVNLNAAGAFGEMSPRLYITIPLALAFYYVYGRLIDQDCVERKAKVAEVYSFFGTMTIAALLRFDLDADFVVTAWAGLALLLTVVSWKTGRRIFLDQGLLIGGGVLLRGILHNLYERSYFPAPFGHGPVASMGTAVALLFLVLPFAFSQRRLETAQPSRYWFQRFLQSLDRRPEQAFFFLPFVLLTALIAVEMRSGLVTLAWGVEALAVFALALWVKERSYRLSGLGLLLLCVAKIIFRDVWGLAPRDRYLTFIVLGSALLAVSYLYTRYRDVLRQYL